VTKKEDKMIFAKENERVLGRLKMVLLFSSSS